MRRSDELPPQEELLATFLELNDTWWRAFIGLQTGAKRVSVPKKKPTILRPGEEPPKPKIVTDPAEIARFLSGRR